LVTCSWCEERFERFLDGAVTGAERERLLTHVDSCAACRGLLDELRVVDGLLIEPRGIELPADFTVATMAEVHALPEPVVTRPPVLAWLVSFIVAAWSLIGAASLIMPTTVRSAGTTVLHVVRDVLFAIGGIGHVIGHIGTRGGGGPWPTLAWGIAIADVLVLAAAVAVVRIARPRIVERLRW
jgi:hypothetical protein